jgi:hypothetical protein
MLKSKIEILVNDARVHELSPLDEDKQAYLEREMRNRLSGGSRKSSTRAVAGV